MQQAPASFQTLREYRARTMLALCITLKLNFCYFDIPIGKIIPDKLLNLSASFAEVIALHEPLGFNTQHPKTTVNPSISQCPARGCSLGLRRLHWLLVAGRWPLLDLRDH